MAGLFGFAGKLLGAPDAPSGKQMDSMSAYTRKQTRGLGDKAYDTAMSMENPYGNRERSQMEGRQHEQIAAQQQSADQELNEQGSKFGYTSGLMDKMRNRNNRGFGDAQITSARDTGLDFIGRRTAFDFDLLNQRNQMAQFGSQQQLGNLQARMAARQAQSQFGLDGMKGIASMVGGGMTGGMA